jgi:hypothetical protein
MKHFLSQREEYLRSHDTGNCTSAVSIGISLLCQPIPSGGINIQFYAPVLQAIGNVLESKRDDLKNGFFGKLIEDKHGIQAIEQFWGEESGCSLENLTLGFIGHNPIAICRRVVRQDVTSYVDDEYESR